MSAGRSSPATKRQPSADEIRLAQAAADAKSQAIAEQLQRDQAWLDKTTKSMSEGEKDELFRLASAKCSETNLDNGRIVIACPVPKKLIYCADADPFSCSNGRSATGRGCKPSEKASKALRDETTCIDANFLADAEGGSYLSPYVPWGPISGASKDGAPIITTKNHSGVTIGTGVDLGAVKDSEAYLKRLEARGVSKETCARLKPLLGKQKEEACKALREAKLDGALVFPADDVELIDVDAMESRVKSLKSAFDFAYLRHIKALDAQIKAEGKKKSGFPSQTKIDDWQRQIDSANEFGDLTCAQQSILFSTFYHEGGIGKRPAGKALVTALLSGDDAGARAAIVSKTESGEKLISNRGKHELSYFDLDE